MGRDLPIAYPCEVRYGVVRSGVAVSLTTVSAAISVSAGSTRDGLRIRGASRLSLRSGERGKWCRDRLLLTGRGCRQAAQPTERTSPGHSLNVHPTPREKNARGWNRGTRCGTKNNCTLGNYRGARSGRFRDQHKATSTP